jgi:hypothetical protein
MLRILLAVAAIVAVVSFAGRAAHAYTGNAPWCAVHNLGMGEVHWDCQFNSIEECRPHILSGNRGFCNPNPYYRAPERRSAPRHRRYRY